MIVLGINGIDGLFHDASATLIVDGRIVASVEEERFNRRKHSDGVPVEAITYCLGKSGIEFADVDHVGYNLDPDVFSRMFYHSIIEKYGCDPEKVEYCFDASQRIRNIKEKLSESFALGDTTRFHFLNHHLAHACSAYYPSGFDRAAVLTIDGAGDRETSTLYRGGPRGLEKIHDFLVYPDSLGYIYTVVAAHLGLGWIAGPGKLMGLAGFGTPNSRMFADIIRLHDDPRRPIAIDLSFFDYYLGGHGFTAKGRHRFGDPRADDEPFSRDHFDLAASMQAALEDAMVHLVDQVAILLPDETDLCLAGGVTLNVSANRRILDRGLFERVFVTPPAYDSGTSLGCALYLDARNSGRSRYAFDVYCGPDVEKDYDIVAACKALEDCIQWHHLSDDALFAAAAESLAANGIVGWVQGRMECGPRALGNRSILCNAMSQTVKDDLNARVKKREGFRPYAPAVLQEECGNWFDLTDSPHMMFEATVLEAVRHRVPGIVHVNGTSRPQTVSERTNPRFYRLIRTFFDRTGVPLVLNTSFNRHGEPMVNRPEEAITVLLETGMDDLFIGNYHVRRKP